MEVRVIARFAGFDSPRADSSSRNVGLVAPGIVALSAPIAPLPEPRRAPDDVELVERARGGDRWASEALYRRHVGRVTRVAARLLRHGADVEDTVQEVFVESLERLASLREPEKVGRWLVGIAVHKAHRRLRRRRLLRALGLDRSIEDERLTMQIQGVPSPELRLTVARIDAALDAMEPSERCCFVLRHLEGYALEEVAALAGVSLATAKRRIAAANARVREIAGEEVGRG